MKPILDIDGALWFLALDNALINGDGYWTRASDYSIYRDAEGEVPHHPARHQRDLPGGDGLRPGRAGRRRSWSGGPGGRPGPGGPGGGHGPGGPGGRAAWAGRRQSGIELDPLIGLDDTRKPLRSRLLAVPSLKARYLDHVRTIAEEWLDWNKLGPVVAQYRALIEKEVEADTRKLTRWPRSRRRWPTHPRSRRPSPRRRPGSGLRAFADQRRKYLLNYPEAPRRPHRDRLECDLQRRRPKGHHARGFVDA